MGGGRWVPIHPNSGWSGSFDDEVTGIQNLPGYITTQDRWQWQVAFFNPSDTIYTVNVYALCAQLTD